MQNPALTSFGIHQASFRDNLDPTYWGMAKILGSAEADLKQELIKLEGGSSIVPWGAAPGRASGELTLTIRQYDQQILRFLAPYLAAGDVADADGEASGSITTPTNAKGTSVINATTGIATIAITTAASLAPGNYKIVATAAGTVDVYVDYDGTGMAEYQNSDMKINTAPLAIAMGAATVFKGLTITGGSGTIGMTVGDIATFTVNPISNYLYQNFFGKNGCQSREFTLSIYSECVGGRIRRTTYPRCIASASTPLNFLENEWASMEATVQILQPEVVDYVADTIYINR